MKNSELEDALAHLEVPPAPDGLLERCLETVPTATVKSRFGGRNTMFLRLIGTVAVVATVAILTTNPRFDRRNRPTAYAAAFAQSEKAMASTPFWIETGRRRNSDWLKKSVDDRWITYQEWFDKKHGYATRNENWSPEGTKLVSNTVYCPNGDEFIRGMRGENCLYILHNGKKSQDLTLQAMHDSIFDPLAVGKSGMVVEDEKVASGIWKGQSVTVFAIVEKPTSTINADLAALRWRTTFYADKKTERFIAKQMEVRWTDHDTDWQVISESEIRYEQPDPSVFDLTKLKEGAAETREQWLTDEGDGYVDRDGKMVGVMSEWLTNHPGQDWQKFRYPARGK
jgi:hypothetical protein